MVEAITMAIEKTMFVEQNSPNSIYKLSKAVFDITILKQNLK